MTERMDWTDGEPAAQLPPAWQQDPPQLRDRKIGVLLTVLAAVYLAPYLFISVRAGEVGVVFHQFGGTATDAGDEYGEGLHFKRPWDTVQRYELRLQQSSDVIPVLSAEGLTVRLSTTIQFRPIGEQIGLLHKEIGPDYLERAVKPELRSILRVLASRRSSEQMYASVQDLQEEVRAIAVEKLSQRHVRVEGVLITEVQFPDSVRQAIDDKLRRAQLSYEYDWRLVQEEKEAMRKQIEAEGIERFQAIASTGMTAEQLLRWRGIDAQLELAKSSNSKVVVLEGKGSVLQTLPLERGAEGAPAPSATDHPTDPRSPPR